MRCPACDGGNRRVPGHPCQDCGDTGVAHCCDGICEQPAFSTHSELMKAAQQASRERSSWLEDMLTDLIKSGVRRDRIEVQDYINQSRTVVLVDGQPRSEWKFSVKVNYP